MSQQYIGILGGVSMCERGVGDIALEKRFNPSWNKICSKENFKISQNSYEKFKHFKEGYVNSNSCNHRSLAFDDPYNYNSYYTVHQ